MNELQIFNFQEQPIRTVEIEGQPWAVAKDVSDALGYKWKGTDTITHVPPEWRGVHSVRTPSGMQEMAVLSKEGLLFFLGRSDKPLAREMQKWAWGTVIPSVLETGSYSVAPVLSDMDKAALMFQQTAGQISQLGFAVQGVQVEVREVGARVEALAIAAAPEKISEQIKAEVATAEALRAAADRNVRALRVHLKGLVKNLAEIRVKRLGTTPAQEYSIAWHLVFAAAYPVSNFDEMRSVEQCQLGIGAIERHLVALGITPPPAPTVTEIVLPQHLNGFGAGII